jgi:hypothetical protein
MLDRWTAASIFSGEIERLDGENIINPPTSFAIARIKAIANFG